MDDPIRATVVGPMTVVAFRDRLLIGQEQAVEIREAILRLVEGGHRTLLFDLDGVEFLASPMLGVLLGIKKKIAASLSPEQRAESLAPEVNPVAVGEPGPLPMRTKAFEVYPDRESAIRVRSERGPGHGWIALCNARPEVGEAFRIC